jgi:uncharacterized Fe-S cluster protein YjdI
MCLYKYVYMSIFVWIYMLLYVCENYKNTMKGDPVNFNFLPINFWKCCLCFDWILSMYLHIHIYIDMYMCLHMSIFVWIYMLLYVCEHFNDPMKGDPVNFNFLPVCMYLCIYV